jgi:hypothetical protein
MKPMVGWVYLKAPFFIMSRISLLLFYLTLPFRFDTFIFISTTKWQWFLLRWIRLFKRETMIIFFGSDIRPVNEDGVLNRLFIGQSDVDRKTRQQKKTVEMVEFYCDYIVSHPPISRFQRRPFYQYMKLGVPVKYKKYCQPGITQMDGDVLKIVHAPTDKHAKGTYDIRESIKTLISRGHKIFYLEMYGRTYDEVMGEILTADIVIDQLYTDIPSSGTSVDAAILGKPAISGTYYDFNDIDLIDGVDYPPCVLCHPYNFTMELEKLIGNEQRRATIGELAGDYIFKKWECQLVARRIMAIFNKRAHNDWIYIPDDETPRYGCGVKRESSRQT